MSEQWASMQWLKNKSKIIVFHLLPLSFFKANEESCKLQCTNCMWWLVNFQWYFGNSSPKRSQIISERAPNYLFWIEIDSQHENVLNYFRKSLKLFLLNWNWFPVWILSHSVRPIYRRQRPPVNASTNIVLFGNNTSYKAATSIKTTTDKISIRYNTLAINQSCRNPIILQICGNIQNKKRQK